LHSIDFLFHKLQSTTTGGCCCDYRRATIVLAILGMVGALYNLISTTYTVEPYPEYHYSPEYWTNFGRHIASFLVMAVMLYGASVYHVTILYVCGALQIVLMIVGIWLAHEIGSYMEQEQDMMFVVIGAWITELIVTALWLYPQVGLILEIKKGILSPETYEQEKYSCCCMNVSCQC